MHVSFNCNYAYAHTCSTNLMSQNGTRAFKRSALAPEQPTPSVAALIPSTPKTCTTHGFNFTTHLLLKANIHANYNGPLIYLLGIRIILRPQHPPSHYLANMAI